MIKVASSLMENVTDRVFEDLDLNHYPESMRSSIIHLAHQELMKRGIEINSEVAR